MTKTEILAQVSAAIDSGLDVVVLQGETVQVAEGTQRVFAMFEPYEDQVAYMKGAARLYNWEAEKANPDYDGVDEDIPKMIPNELTFEKNGRKIIRDFAKNIANVQNRWEAEQAALKDLKIKTIE